jgi:hypothetical protein
VESRVIVMCSNYLVQILDSCQKGMQWLSEFKKNFTKALDYSFFITRIRNYRSPFSKNLKERPREIFSWVLVLYAKVFPVLDGSILKKDVIRPLERNRLVGSCPCISGNCRSYCFEIQKVDGILHIQQFIFQFL